MSSDRLDNMVYSSVCWQWGSAKQHSCCDIHFVLSRVCTFLECGQSCLLKLSCKSLQFCICVWEIRNLTEIFFYSNSDGSPDRASLLCVCACDSSGSAGDGNASRTRRRGTASLRCEWERGPWGVPPGEISRSEERTEVEGCDPSQTQRTYLQPSQWCKAETVYLLPMAFMVLSYCNNV